MEDYEKVREIGRGSYGIVFQCKHKVTGALVAVKQLRDEDANEQTRKTALREAKILRQLQHPNVVRLLELFRSKTKLYMIFEYVDKSVLQVLEGHPRGLPAMEVKKIMWQLLLGLSFLHSQQIIHRDLKPENILMTTDGLVKLCDFGFAREHMPTCAAGQGGQKLSPYVATRWYRAPELLVGDNYSNGVDVWALGCLLVELTTGQPLFPGRSAVDQLYLILKAVGVSPRQASRMQADPMLRTLQHPKEEDMVTLDKRFQYFDKHSLAFVKACLAPDPKERPSCQQLMKHEYFATVQSVLQPYTDQSIQMMKSQTTTPMKAASTMQQTDAAARQFTKQVTSRGLGDPLAQAAHDTGHQNIAKQHLQGPMPPSNLQVKQHAPHPGNNLSVAVPSYGAAGISQASPPDLIRGIPDHAASDITDIPVVAESIDGFDNDGVIGDADDDAEEPQMTEEKRRKIMAWMDDMPAHIQEKAQRAAIQKQASDLTAAGGLTAAPGVLSATPGVLPADAGVPSSLQQHAASPSNQPQSHGSPEPSPLSLILQQQQQWQQKQQLTVTGSPLTGGLPQRVSDNGHTSAADFLSQLAARKPPTTARLSLTGYTPTDGVLSTDLTSLLPARQIIEKRKPMKTVSTNGLPMFGTKDLVSADLVANGAGERSSRAHLTVTTQSSFDPAAIDALLDNATPGPLETLILQNASRSAPRRGASVEAMTAGMWAGSPANPILRVSNTGNMQQVQALQQYMQALTGTPAGQTSQSGVASPCTGMASPGHESTACAADTVHSPNHNNGSPAKASPVSHATLPPKCPSPRFSGMRFIHSEAGGTTSPTANCTSVTAASPTSVSHSHAVQASPRGERSSEQHQSNASCPGKLQDSSHLVSQVRHVPDRQSAPHACPSKPQSPGLTLQTRVAKQGPSHPELPPKATTSQSSPGNSTAAPCTIPDKEEGFTKTGQRTVSQAGDDRGTSSGASCDGKAALKILMQRLAHGGPSPSPSGAAPAQPALAKPAGGSNTTTTQAVSGAGSPPVQKAAGKAADVEGKAQLNKVEQSQTVKHEQQQQVAAGPGAAAKQAAGQLTKNNGTAQRADQTKQMDSLKALLSSARPVVQNNKVPAVSSDSQAVPKQQPQSSVHAAEGSPLSQLVEKYNHKQHSSNGH